MMYCLVRRILLLKRSPRLLFSTLFGESCEIHTKRKLQDIWSEGNATCRYGSALVNCWLPRSSVYATYISNHSWLCVFLSFYIMCNAFPLCGMCFLLCV